MPRARGSGKGIVEKRVKTIDPKTGNERTRVYIYARVSYTDKSGKRRAKWRKAENRTDAVEKKAELLAELKRQDDRAAGVVATRTFGELANYYATTSLIPAEFRDGRRIRGRRSLGGMRRTLARLCLFFGVVEHKYEAGVWEGGRALDAITYDDIDEFRLKLLSEPVRVRRIRKVKRKGVRKHERIEYYDERPRKIASVNRALEMLRNMLCIAVRRGWMARNPFQTGHRALISAADEVTRRRLLTFDEEARLLASCTGKREHLRAIIICALDTAMRAGEIFKLKVQDVQSDSAGRRRIVVQQMNTKTLQARNVPISSRLQAELNRLLEVKLSQPDALLFGVTTAKRSFIAARDEAGIEGLRFHDLRRTAATRLHRGVPALGIQGMPIGEISRLLGHNSIKTTYRYIGTDEDTTDRAASLFDRINEYAARGQLRLVREVSTADHE
jgi:integrase